MPSDHVPTPAASTDPAPEGGLREAVEALAGLDYDPSQEAWVCGDHGIPECEQGACADLPWPKPNGSPLLAAFTDWADAQFRRIVRPYDLSDDPDGQMPEEAFRSYSLYEWPVGDYLAAHPAPETPEQVQGGGEGEAEVREAVMHAMSLLRTTNLSAAALAEVERIESEWTADRVCWVNEDCIAGHHMAEIECRFPSWTEDAATSDAGGVQAGGGEGLSDLAGAISPTADLAVRIATYIDGHYDSDTGAWINDALDEVLPKWLDEYVYADQAAHDSDLVSAAATRARAEGAAAERERIAQIGAAIERAGKHLNRVLADPKVRHVGSDPTFLAVHDAQNALAEAARIAGSES